MSFQDLRGSVRESAAGGHTDEEWTNKIEVLRQRVAFLERRLVQDRVLYRMRGSGNPVIEETPAAVFPVEGLALRHEVEALRNSTSWRVTAPIRLIGRLIAGTSMKRALHTLVSASRLL